MAVERAGVLLPLREHRRITLHCPACGQFSMMPIRRKVRLKRKVHYDVDCPRCGHAFRGCRRNELREWKRRYKLTWPEYRSVQGWVWAGRKLRPEDPEPEAVFWKHPNLRVEAELTVERFHAALDRVLDRR